MKKILLAAVLILITAIIIYAAANSHSAMSQDCRAEWEQVK